MFLVQGAYGNFIDLKRTIWAAWPSVAKSTLSGRPARTAEAAPRRCRTAWSNVGRAWSNARQWTRCRPCTNMGPTATLHRSLRRRCPRSSSRRRCPPRQARGPVARPAAALALGAAPALGATAACAPLERPGARPSHAADEAQPLLGRWPLRGASGERLGPLLGRAPHQLERAGDGRRSGALARPCFGKQRGLRARRDQRRVAARVLRQGADGIRHIFHGRIAAARRR
jgi:hypothetical protein